LGDINQQKRREVVLARHTGVIASRSELLSPHCPRRPLLLALLPALAGSQVIMRQDCSAYAEGPLRTVGLLEAAHQYSLQDVCRSASTPVPAILPTQEWQFKNLRSHESLPLDLPPKSLSAQAPDKSALWCWDTTPVAVVVAVMGM
jgi:hypothetical protein